MDTLQAQFTYRLKDAGERLTSPRLAIFTALVKRGPINLPKLVSHMRHQAIDPATTYRNIQLFSKLGVVQFVGAGNRQMIELSDIYDSHHHHFWCSACHRVIDFDSQEIEADLARVANHLGVRIQSHHLELNGLCQRCSAHS